MKLIEILSKRDELLEKSNSGLVPVKETVHRKDGISYTKTVWKKPDEVKLKKTAEEKQFTKLQKVQVYSNTTKLWYDSTILNDELKDGKVLLKRAIDGKIFYADPQGVRIDEPVADTPLSIEVQTLNYKFTNGTETEIGSEAEQIDSDVALVLATLPFHGFRVSVAKLDEIKEKLETRQKYISEKIGEMTGLDKVNPNKKKEVDKAFLMVTTGAAPISLEKDYLFDTYIGDLNNDSNAVNLASLLYDLGEVNRKINQVDKLKSYASNSHDYTIQNEYSTNSRTGRVTSKGVVFTKEIELPDGFEVDKNKIYSPGELKDNGIYGICCLYFPS